MFSLMTEREENQSVTNIDILWAKTPEDRLKAGRKLHDSLVQWHKHLHRLGLPRIPITLFDGDKYRIAFSDLGRQNKMWKGTASVAISFGVFHEDKAGKKYCVGVDNRGMMSFFPYIKGKGGASFEMVKNRFSLNSQQAAKLGFTQNVFQGLIYQNYLHIGQILREREGK